MDRRLRIGVRRMPRHGHQDYPHNFSHTVTVVDHTGKTVIVPHVDPTVRVQHTGRRGSIVSVHNISKTKQFVLYGEQSSSKENDKAKKQQHRNGKIYKHTRIYTYTSHVNGKIPTHVSASTKVQIKNAIPNMKLSPEQSKKIGTTHRCWRHRHIHGSGRKSAAMKHNASTAKSKAKANAT